MNGGIRKEEMNKQKSQFGTIFEDALNRDCSRIWSVSHLRDEYPTAPLAALARLADGLTEIRTEFLQAADSLAQQQNHKYYTTLWGITQPRFSFVCRCGNPNCSQAQLITLSGK